MIRGTRFKPGLGTSDAGVLPPAGNVPEATRLVRSSLHHL